MADVKFQKLNEELEKIIIELQSGDVDIDTVVEKYEKGILLIDKLENHLNSAKNKIKKLSQKDLKTK